MKREPSKKARSSTYSRHTHCSCSSETMDNQQSSSRSTEHIQKAAIVAPFLAAQSLEAGLHCKQPCRWVRWWCERIWLHFHVVFLLRNTCILSNLTAVEISQESYCIFVWPSSPQYIIQCLSQSYIYDFHYIFIYFGERVQVAKVK